MDLTDFKFRPGTLIIHQLQPASIVVVAQHEVREVHQDATALVITLVSGLALSVDLVDMAADAIEALMDDLVVPLMGVIIWTHCEKAWHRKACQPARFELTAR